MRVRDLIHDLQKIDPDYNVVILVTGDENTHDSTYHITGIEEPSIGNAVYLEYGDDRQNDKLYTWAG